MDSLTSLSRNELDAISNCDFSKEILAVQKGEIVKVSKDQITCWQLFLRFLGLGSFANMAIHLKDVATYLDKYDWKEGVEKTSSYHDVYLKVCEIANRALLTKEVKDLYDHVSMSKSMNLRMTQRQGFISTHVNSSHQVYWNPNCQFQHILARARLDFSVPGSLWIIPAKTEKSEKSFELADLHMRLAKSEQLDDYKILYGLADRRWDPFSEELQGASFPQVKDKQGCFYLGRPSYRAMTLQSIPF